MLQATAPPAPSKWGNLLGSLHLAVIGLLADAKLLLVWATAIRTVLNLFAFLEVWSTGTEGGDALADHLAGAPNPGGKLPLTCP
jgi:hypothetical protein